MTVEGTPYPLREIGRFVPCEHNQDGCEKDLRRCRQLFGLLVPSLGTGNKNEKSPCVFEQPRLGRGFDSRRLHQSERCAGPIRGSGAVLSVLMFGGLGLFLEFRPESPVAESQGPLYYVVDLEARTGWRSSMAHLLRI